MRGQSGKVVKKVQGKKTGKRGRPPGSCKRSGSPTLMPYSSKRFAGFLDKRIACKDLLDDFGYPKEHPVNTDTYRYKLAREDEWNPLKKEFEKLKEDPFSEKLIPGFLYREHCFEKVSLSPIDKAHQLLLDSSYTSVTGSKGYAGIRASHGVNYGSWYFEVRFDSIPASSCARIGWAMAWEKLQAPIGFSLCSYSLRSSSCTAFHASRGKDLAKNDFKPGDVLGCLIKLPGDIYSRTERLPQTLKDTPMCIYKRYLWYEETIDHERICKNLNALPDSEIKFYKNGQLLGTAFKHVYQEEYFPAISLYHDITVTANFGPKFRFAPKDEFGYRPMSERAEEYAVEKAAADVLYSAVNGGRPTVGTYFDKWLRDEYPNM